MFIGMEHIATFFRMICTAYIMQKQMNIKKKEIKNYIILYRRQITLLKSEKSDGRITVRQELIIFLLRA